MYCCKQYMTVSGLGREGVSCGNVVSHVTHALCLASLAVGPDHRARRATQTQEAPFSPAGFSKLLRPVSDRSPSRLSSVVLVSIMYFPQSHPVRFLPPDAAAWIRVANATREGHYVAWGPDVLVNVDSSKLVEAMPLFNFTVRAGQKFLPLNVIVFFLGRLGWVEDRSLAIDLTCGLSPATLNKFEAWAVADKRLDWSPTSETGFLQRVLVLAAELAASGPLPAELKVDQNSFVPFEGHDDSAGGPDWTDSWQSRMTAFSLTQSTMLGPFADVALLLGPMLREDVRTDPGGRPMLVAETLASWATAGSLASFAAVHQRLPLLVSEALKEHVLPIELTAAITAFPAMLRDLDARIAWSDATKSASVLRFRFPCALYSLPALAGLLEGEAEMTKFDTACDVLASQLKVTAPSLAAFSRLDRHLTTVGYDLSGGTASERMDSIAARDERDEDLRAAAPYGGTGSGGGGAGKTTLDSEPKPRMHIKTTVKLLQNWLNSPEVNGPLVYSTVPVAAAFGVAAVAGVPDEAQSGVGALITYYHDLGDSHEVLRVALARRSVPLTQAVVYDVSTSHPIFDAISSARGDLTAFVSYKLASLDDGNLEMESDELWRAKPEFVVKLIEGKWSKINWYDDVHRAIELERCKSAAPASAKSVDQQWFCSKAALVVTYADRALSILGFNRNGEFHTTVTNVLRMTKTTPASSANKAQLKEHAVRQIVELLNAAATRYRAFIGASSCVPFPAFTNAADKATAMQEQAKATRHLVSSIGACMPGMLHGHGAAPVHDDDDDDDDDSSGGGGKPAKKAAKRKAAKALTDTQQANRDAKKSKALGGGGGGGDSNKNSSSRGQAGVPGDSVSRVTIKGDLISFHWPKITGVNGRDESDRTFDVSGVKKELLAAGVKDVGGNKLCVPFQFMYALSSSFTDDDRRLAHAHRFCSNTRHSNHNSVTASAHEQLPGLDRAMLVRNES